MYVEVVIALNTLFNYIVLSFTNKTCSFRSKKRRLLLSALLGGGIVAFWGNSFVVMVLSFVIMILSAFGIQFAKWTQGAMVTLIAGLFAGGLLTVLEPVYFHMPTMYFTSSTGMAAFIGLSVLKNRWTNVKRQATQQQFLLSTTLILFNEIYPITAFVDTGNTCIEPLSGKPVHFVAYNVLKDRLPEELTTALRNWDENHPYTLTMFPKHLHNRIRIIRFTTVQKQAVYGVGFRYDDWLIQSDGEQSLEPGYLVFTEHGASFPQAADAILHFSTIT